MTIISVVLVKLNRKTVVNMFYILYISKSSYKRHKDSYMFFESDTESFFEGTKNFLNYLILKDKIDSNYVDLVMKDNIAKDRCNAISSNSHKEKGAEKTLLCKIAKNKYKLVTYLLSVATVSGEELRELIRKKDVTNCEIVNGTYKSIGTYRADKDIQFEREIAKKYEKHIAITSLLGCRTTFDYVIEGKEVKIKSCNSTTGKVIIPKFVTIILDQALSYSRITELTLNEGLKAIGSQALKYNNITELVIPKTVQFIGRSPFIGNNKIIDSGGKYTNKLKILNKRALILDECK